MSQHIDGTASSLRRELLEDIPQKIPYARNTNTIRRNIELYCDAAVKCIERWAAHCTDQETSSLRASCEETRRLLESTPDSGVKDLAKKMREQCDGVLHRIAASDITEICDLMHQALLDASLNLRSAAASLTTPTDLVLLDARGRLSYREEVLSVSPQCLSKLQALYEAHSHTQSEWYRSETTRLAFTWVLIRRYQALLGWTRRFEGTGLQAAVPPSVFHALTRLFGVSMECFASPFNCHFPQYCSAFSDIDVAFGSRGSFFAFTPKEGSFEANPPFCEELMVAMVDHMEHSLSNTICPLSFIIVLPDWTDPLPDAATRLLESPYLQRSIATQAHEHSYVSHEIPAKCSSNTFTPVHSTRITFLQNQAGAATWPVTDAKVGELLSVWRNNRR